MLKLLLFSLALASTALAMGQDQPRDVEINFSLSYGGLEIAEVVDRLIFGANGEYVIESKAQSTGLAKLLNKGNTSIRSEGKILPSGRPAMHNFSYDSNRTHRRAQLAPDGGTVTITDKDVTREAFVLMPQVDDLLTVLYMHYITGHLVRDDQIQLTDGRKLKIYDISFAAAPVDITTPAGTFTAEHGKRVTLASDRIRIAWFAEDLSFLPVQFISSDGGLELKLSLLSYRFEPPANSAQPTP